MSDSSMDKAVVLAKESNSDHSEVRSIAEVKHGTVHFLTHFSPLQMNTNLHIPPSNWLRSSSKLEQHVKDLTWHSSRSSEFSSISMAHNSPDLTGEVDVITNAENIKKLLKMPYEKSHMSMMVHRIGKSLLLDEFDIHKHLFRQEQTDWRWLRQFYYETILRDLEAKMKCVPRQRKSRNYLRNRNLYSKFLYHSLGYNPEEGVKEDVAEHSGRPLPQGTDQTLLPDPLPQPEGMQNHREVLWTFEDIKMLIGTDLPIFCDESYYVSLRLRDMRTPINVLTGLDYWLDNLMCNVPEVAMCFHINGIVKKYEVLKTEDIPNIENSQFDPQVVTDIAKNILSFLKTNATKEGHTYWLYKGSDDDVVKLYDLTALCDSTKATDENPFMVPIGMLLYRVARNMWTNFRHRKAPVIRTLLENCLFLLDEEKHSQVYTSANYLLSDLFVPDSSLNDDWSPTDSGENSDDDNSQDTEEESDSANVTSVDVQTLCTDSRQNRCKELVRLKPIKESIEERCIEALKFIHTGLLCLDHDLLKQTQQSNSVIEEQAQCNRDEPIPLHYKPLDRVDHSKFLQMASVVSEESSESWHHLSKGLMFRKAAMAFIALCKLKMSRSQYISGLRCIRSALYCYECLCTVLPRKAAENKEIVSTLLSLAGDIRLVIGKTPDLTVDWGAELKNASPEETAIVEYAEKEIKEFEFDWLLEVPDTGMDNLQCSVRCYSESVKLVTDTKGDNYTTITKRLGNAYNELGVCQMQKALELSQEEDLEDGPSQQLQALWRSCQQNLQEGLETFESIQDIANQILLHCNHGRLMRLCAQTYTQISLRGSVKEFSSMERHYYNQAIDRYKTALMLGKNDNVKPLHDSVIWELSTTYFNMATLLQDYAPLSTQNQEEIEKEVIDLMNKSLKYCKGDSSSARQPMYQYRSATINHRLASLFHNSFRSQMSEQKKRRLRQLADNYYDKAVQQFQQMDCAVEGLRVQLEWLALLDFTLAGHSNPRSRLRILLQMLHLVSDTQDLVKSMIRLLGDPEEESKHLEEGEKILEIMESRLQFILLQLVKAYTASNLKKHKTDSSTVTELKSLYAGSLKQGTSGINSSPSLLGRFTFLQTFLAQVSNFYQQHKSLEQELHLSTSS